LKGVTGVGRRKALLLILLALSVAAVLSAGTLAAYNMTLDVDGVITASQMVFKVNGSGAETQPLSSPSLKPGESATIPIAIDTAGTAVPMDVTLSVTASGGNLPPGLEVTVDGNSVGASGTGTRTLGYPGLNGQARTVSVVVSWNATAEQLKSLYDKSTTFTLSLSATVTATQAVS
jgi:hypothetical protein